MRNNPCDLTTNPRNIPRLAVLILIIAIAGYVSAWWHFSIFPVELRDVSLSGTNVIFGILNFYKGNIVQTLEINEKLYKSFIVATAFDNLYITVVY